jgi:molybdate transport system permease protein
MNNTIAPFLLSLKISFITTLILSIISPFLSWAIFQSDNRMKIPLRILVNLPLVLPPSVLGFYFLLVFSPSSMIGHWISISFHKSFLFTTEGLILGSVMFSLPFMVNPLISGLESLPRSLFEASYVLGKSGTVTFMKVILPNCKQSLLAGIVMTFVHTMGEFGLVLMIGGKVPGKTLTASIAVFDYMESLQYGMAHLYAALLVLVSFSILGVLFTINSRFRII